MGKNNSYEATLHDFNVGPMTILRSYIGDMREKPGSQVHTDRKQNKAKKKQNKKKNHTQKV